jgi:hypothetical protein
MNGWRAEARNQSLLVIMCRRSQLCRWPEVPQWQQRQRRIRYGSECAIHQPPVVVPILELDLTLCGSGAPRKHRKLSPRTQASSVLAERCDAKKATSIRSAPTLYGRW